MRKKLLLFAVVAGFISFFISAGLFAGSAPSDVITMKTEGYTEHKQSICEFQHKKHAEERDLTCGGCHHDEKGDPLELKAGDDVSTCIACHDKPGQKPKGKDVKKLTPQEKLQYHAEAMHTKCKACHRGYNKENKTKAAPITCSGCHPKS